MKDTRKKWSSEEIIRIVRRTLLDREEISKVCEDEGCQPSQVYKWQATLFAEGAVVFARKSSSGRKERLEERARIETLEEKLQKKNEVLSELLEEHVELKKSLGES